MSTARSRVQIISVLPFPPRHTNGHASAAVRQGWRAFSQHMLGHAEWDFFFIPDVPLEQVPPRWPSAAARRPVGFLPDIGVALRPSRYRQHSSLAAHGPTISWPASSRKDARCIFPPMATRSKGYELGPAPRSRRRGGGDDASSVSKPSLLARLFGSKSSDERG